MVCGLSSSGRVEQVERPRNYKPENRPNELSPQRVGRFLAVAVVVVRWVLVAGGAVGAGRVDAGTDFVLIVSITLGRYASVATEVRLAVRLGGRQPWSLEIVGPVTP